MNGYLGFASRLSDDIGTKQAEQKRSCNSGGDGTAGKMLALLSVQILWLESKEDARSMFTTK